MYQRLKWYKGDGPGPDEFCVRPVYVLELLGERLKIHEQILKTVVFIGAENPRGFTPYGTALLGFVEYEGHTIVILVTCPHVVDLIPGDIISIRINRRDGTSETRGYLKSNFLGFEDKSLDICGAPIALDPSIYDFFPIPLNSKSWRKSILEEGAPAIGEEVCVVGLYTSHFGYVQNRPVVRMGHIAASFEEKVMTNRGYVWGFLIECHSIAGLSGSPVFWMKNTTELKDGKVVQRRAYLPLGILLGYHVVESKEDEIVVPQFQNDDPPNRDDKGVDERRTGFSVVLPINHAHDIVESEEFMKRTKEALEDFKKKKGSFREASAVPSANGVRGDAPASDANLNHREDFNSLLGEAARKHESKD
jgi:hypothetical protein